MTGATRAPSSGSDGGSDGGAPLDPASVLREGARSLGYGLAAGALAGAPALVRALGGAETRNPWVLVGLVALPMAVVAPVVLALRRARLPHVVPPGEAPRVPLLRVLGAALALAVAPLAWLGTWLEQGTHHRPLGAVTFACAALAVFTVALIVGRRLLALGASQPANRRGAVALVCLGVPAALGAWLLLRGILAGLEVGGVWLDGLGVVLWTAVGVSVPSRPVPARSVPSKPKDSHGGDDVAASRLWRIAIVSWLSVCALGALALVTHAPELTTVAPAFTWPVR